MKTSVNKINTACRPEIVRTRSNGKLLFCKYMLGIIERKARLGRNGTSKNYSATLNSFLKFMHGSDVSFSRITPDLIEEYGAWLMMRRVSTNSISFYMRNLRAVYNMAVEAGLVIDRRPFRKAYTKIERTAKRAIPLSDIKRIKNLDLDQLPDLALARDIFMFLFYCRGMSFIDAVHLSASNIIGNQLIYRRHKTGQELRIGINRHILDLLGKWHSRHAPSGYLLPVLSHGAAAHRKIYETALRKTNRSLKAIASMAGINTSLTTYVSRHSWASIAKSKGIATATISDALGHDSELTTQIYLSTLASDVIDHANSVVLNDL